MTNVEMNVKREMAVHGVSRRGIIGGGVAAILLVGVTGKLATCTASAATTGMDTDTKNRAFPPKNTTKHNERKPDEKPDVKIDKYIGETEKNLRK